MMKKLIIFLVLVLSLYAFWLAQEVILILGYFFIVSLIVILITIFIFGVWWLREKMLVIRATRIEAQKQSEVLVIKSPTGIWVRDTGNAKYQALHLDQSDTLGWQIYNGSRSIKSSEPLLLEAPQQELKPILSQLKNAGRVLVGGGSDSGKTNLAKHIIVNRSQDSEVIIIDPHAPSKIMGIDVIGAGMNYDKIDDTMLSLVEIMRGRYEDVKNGKYKHHQHPKLFIVIDELTSIIDNCQSAPQAIKDLLTQSRKVSISMLLLIHGLDTKTLKVPAGIRSSSTLVWLEGSNAMPYKSFILPSMGVQSSRKTWEEFSRENSFIGYPEIENITTQLPSSKNIKIKNLSNQGFSPTAIARNIFSTKKATGPQIKHIQDILATL